ncbi:MAG: hypothetical protein ACOCM8_00210 [Acetivibrio ethanolgignens]
MKKTIAMLIALVFLGGIYGNRTVEAVELEGKTREEAAVWVCQEMEKQGEKKNEKLLDVIEMEKRISDLNRIKKENREAVLLAYHWGIMGGSSNGSYSKSRSFQGNQKLTLKEWKEIKVRIQKPEKRLKLSPDGQLCRMTRLPSNYKKFPYILDSYPNSYYESTFDYEWYADKLKEGKDYVNPSKMDKAKFISWNKEYPLSEIREKYGEDWKKCIEQNLKTRLNVDYRKVSKDFTWFNNLRNTYYLYGDWEQDLQKTEEIEEYIEKIKRNKVIIKGTVDIDSSTLYKSLTGYFMRAHIKFKIISAKEIPKDQRELFFGSHVYFKNLKKGVWREAVVDIGLATANFCSDGRDFAVFTDNLVDPMKK